MDLTFRSATDVDADRIVRFWRDAGASMTPLDTVEHVRRLIVHRPGECWSAIGYPLDTHIVRHLGQLP